MVAGIMNYFSRGSTTPAPVAEDKDTPIRALPASWYTSKEMYELERRAIFSKRWLFITHRLRLAQAGDYLRYDIAGFQIVLARDREGKINGFHNVCRHRAYPVVAEEKGTARIFSCKYHGWSYGLNGKLAKAPGYQELSNFDKNANGLFPIHVHIDSNGFIWINLDGKEKPEISWEEQCGGMNQKLGQQPQDFDSYTFDHSWEMEGEYNWKIPSDYHNESCLSTTPQSETSTISDSSVQSSNSSTQSHASSTSEESLNNSTVSPTFLFPNTAINITPQFLIIQTYQPTSPTTTTTRHEIFRHPTATDQSLQFLTQTSRHTATTTAHLHAITQKTFDSNTSVPDPQGSLLFHKTVRDAISAHHAREQSANAEIWPARQMTAGEKKKTREEIDFCSGLACAPASQEGLAW